MTNQEKKAYLGRYRCLDQQIQRTVDELSRWRSRAAKVTPSYSEDPPGGEGGDRIQTAVEQIIRLEQEANRQIDELLLVRREIEAAVQAVPDEVLRLLLRYRYIDGLTWEQVAERMDYTDRWVRVLHRRAIEAIELKQFLVVPGQSVI